MTAFLLGLASQMITSAALSAASTAGHEAGIAFVKKVLPWLSDDQVLVIFHAARKRIEEWGAGMHQIEVAPNAENLALSLGITLNADGTIPISNPIVPPDPGPM